jgi:leader peptidase (prepilin peptidase) / N-methyltransferase
MHPLAVFAVGLIFGSFISALSYRMPRGISINKGRSVCPKCKKKINWYDNVPVLSYIILRGRCRNCGKKISIRYPLIELTTATLFLISYNAIVSCGSVNMGAICDYSSVTGVFTFPFIAALIVLFISIFVTDFEHQLINDELVFIGLGLVLFVFLAFDIDKFFQYVFTGFASSIFFLVLHLITKGKGMGLGDVKFALLGGMLTGWPLVLVWLFLSFLIGSVVGVFLILIGKAKFGKNIAFGPFLIISLLLVLFWGHNIKDALFLGVNF